MLRTFLIFSIKYYKGQNWLKRYLQISLLMFSEMKLINEVVFPLKSSENMWFPDARGIEVNYFAQVC